jgi:hypothetical protein
MVSSNVVLADLRAEISEISTDFSDSSPSDTVLENFDTQAIEFCSQIPGFGEGSLELFLQTRSMEGIFMDFLFYKEGNQ